MSSHSHRFSVDRMLRAARAGAGAILVATTLGLAAAGAAAQTYGVATMPPGTLNHTTGSAIAKVLKEKGGLNVLVQPTAGESSLIPMVGRAEADLCHTLARWGVDGEGTATPRPLGDPSLRADVDP